MTAGALEAAVEAALGLPLPRRLGVAVSGGSDSLALLYLLKDICSRTGTTLEVVTVDHGLRDGSDTEAARVGELCARAGLHHTVLRWQGWDRSGNLQDAARQARYALMADWARVRGITAIALGHTADDQAETVLMRLARRSGVDGLAAMAPSRADRGVTWLRPLLETRREELRAYLRAKKIAWTDDPSNEDTRFDRIKARRALGALGEMGIDTNALGVVAQNMNEAREALESVTQDVAARMVRLCHGAVVFDRTQFLAQPAEIQRRLLRRALNWIVPTPYPPRRMALTQMMRAILDAQGTTLGGCAVISRKNDVWLFREFNPVAGMQVPPDTPWDDRWLCRPTTEASPPTGSIVQALSANGLKQCDNWRDLHMPRDLLLSHPALWHGDTVLSSPAAKPHANWRWQLVRDEKAFFSTAL